MTSCHWILSFKAGLKTTTMITLTGVTLLSTYISVCARFTSLGPPLWGAVSHFGFIVPICHFPRCKPAEAQATKPLLRLCFDVAVEKHPGDFAEGGDDEWSSGKPRERRWCFLHIPLNRSPKLKTLTFCAQPTIDSKSEVAAPVLQLENLDVGCCYDTLVLEWLIPALSSLKTLNISPRSQFSVALCSDQLALSWLPSIFLEWSFSQQPVSDMWVTLLLL